MKAQKYRHRIHILEPTDTQDPTTGKITRLWSTFYLGAIPLNAYPAEVLTGPGRETHAAGTKLAETTARINFRWFPGLRADMCIVWDDLAYDILSIERDVTGQREYRLRCKEGLIDIVIDPDLAYYVVSDGIPVVNSGTQVVSTP